MLRRSLLNLKAVTLSIFLLGLLYEGPVFAQNETGEAGTATDTTQVQQEEHDTKDLEKLLKRYNTDSEKVIDDTSKMQNTDASTSEVSEKEIDEMRPEDSLNSGVKHVLRKKKTDEEPFQYKSFSENIRVPLAKFQSLSEEELLKLLKDNTKDSKWGSYLDHFPKMTLFSVRLIKDRDAIPSAVKIIEDKNKLSWFAGIMIATFLLGFLLERIMRKEGRGVLASIGLYFIRVLIMSGVRLFIVIYFYGQELKPASLVFEKTFL